MSAGMVLCDSEREMATKRCDGQSGEWETWLSSSSTQDHEGILAHLCDLIAS